jgi:hypothetical protein
MRNLLPKSISTFYLSQDICLEIAVLSVFVHSKYNSGNATCSAQSSYKNILRLFQPCKCKTLAVQYRTVLLLSQITRSFNVCCLFEAMLFIRTLFCTVYCTLLLTFCLYMILVKILLKVGFNFTRSCIFMSSCCISTSYRLFLNQPNWKYEVTCFT